MDRFSSGRASSGDLKTVAPDRSSLPSDATAGLDREALAAESRERSSAPAQDRERALADGKMKQLGFAGADDLLNGFGDSAKDSEATKPQRAGAEESLSMGNSGTGAEAPKVSAAKIEQSGEGKDEADYGAVVGAIADGALNR